MLTACFAILAMAEDEGLCGELTRFVSANSSEHTERAVNRLAELFEIETEACGNAIAQDGGANVICQWVFPYRSEAARIQFEDLKTKTGDCLAPNTEEALDQPLNHPDFYEQISFRSEAAEIAVSLKDKGALAKTYVFFRVTLYPGF